MGKGIYINEKELKELKKLVSENNNTLDFISKVVGKKTKKKKKKILKDKKYLSKEERAELFRTDLIKKQTEGEKKFKSYLKSLKIDYSFQKIFYIDNSFRIVDFFLPECNVVIEIDGGYHNNTKIKDIIRTGELERFGVQKVYRFKNEELENSIATIDRIKGIFSRHTSKKDF